MKLIKIDKVINLMVCLFYYIGFWHRGFEPSARELRTKIFYCIYHFLFFVSLVVGAIISKKEDEAIFLLETSIGAIGLSVKLWALIWKQDEILDLLNRFCVFTIRYEEDEAILNAKFKIFRKFVIIFCIMGFIACSDVLFVPFIVNERKLVFEIGFPFDYENSEIAFWIANTFIFTECVLSMIITFYSMIIWYLLLCCALRYKVLGSELKKTGRITDTPNDNITVMERQSNFSQDLNASVDAHLHLRGYNQVYNTVVEVMPIAIFYNTSLFDENMADFIRKKIHHIITTTISRKILINELESFLSNIFLFLFGTSALSICGSTYCLAFDVGDSLSKRCMHILTLYYFISDLFMTTYFGNEIKVSSDALTYNLFESDWVEQPQSTKKNIIIFAEYLKQPHELVIGKLYTLTLETFTRILNSAYSMFNILKSLQK